MKKPITPKTKVAELLKDYPELESELIAISPEFNKLKNPILRKTVARITNLEQAAKIANLQVGDVINKLRLLAGFEQMEIDQSSAGSFDDFNIEDFTIQESFDATPIINAGEHPMHDVIALMEKLEHNSMLELITPFLPLPLLEIGKGRGLKVKSITEGETVIKSYFLKV